MAYIQRITPPPNKILNFSLRNFAGGLNNRSEQLRVNEASDLLNMKFADETLMEKRNGTTYFDEFDAGGSVIFIDEFKPYNDSNVLIRATSEKVYFGEKEVATVTGQISGTNFKGKYFFIDGDKLYVYGKFAQSTSTYEKVIGTPVDDYVLMQITNPPDDYTPLGTEHVKGVTNIDYTNKKIWYEPCKHESEDTFKGKNVLPEKAKYVVSHNGRLYISGADKDDDNIFISDIANPYYFPVTLPIQIPPDSDKVVGLVVFDDSIVIGRQNDIHVISGNTNRPGIGVDVFKLSKLNTHTGFANNTAFNLAHNYLFFLGSDGNFYSLGNTKYDERTLATIILSKTIDLEKSPINLSIDDIKTATSIFFKDEWYISIKDKVLIYSYRHRSWTMFNNINARSFYNLDNLLIWGREDGRLAKFSEDYYDFGKPFQAYWVSKYFDMDESSVYKQFREFFLIAHTFEEYASDIDVTFEIDYMEVNDKHTVESKISIWGKAKWGDRFIDRNIVVSLPFIIGRRGRMIRFKFSNSYFPFGTVETYNDLANLSGKKEGQLIMVTNENMYYLYTDNTWQPMREYDLNQTMKIYQVNGDYELRGKR